MGKKILDCWQSIIGEIFDDCTKNRRPSVRTNYFAGPPLMKDKVRAAINVKNRRVSGPDNISIKAIAALDDYGM